MDIRHSPSKTMFQGRAITYEAIHEALQLFNIQYPLNDYDQWLEKPIYKYAIAFDGKLYPPKYILSVVSLLSIDQFSGGENTNRVFRQLGFSIVDKSGVQTHPTYLLTWDPSKFAWQNFEDDWNSVSIGYPPYVYWKFSDAQTIAVGNRVFLMQLDEDKNSNGVIASGWVTNTDQHHAQTIEFKPDVILNPKANSLLVFQYKDFTWSSDSSSIVIPEYIAYSLETAWYHHIQSAFPISITSSSHTEAKTYKEGTKVLVSSYHYERNTKAREACLKKHDRNCSICGFNFNEVWGDLGKGFIHVHHLTLISTQKTEYEINPEKDLRPVCPNCHAMIHRKSPPYSIEELRALRKSLHKEQSAT